MLGVSDYISMALLALIGIAAFINITRGTFGSWVQAKFLGKSTGTTPSTPFTPAKAAA